MNDELNSAPLNPAFDIEGELLGLAQSVLTNGGLNIHPVVIERMARKVLSASHELQAVEARIKEADAIIDYVYDNGFDGGAMKMIGDYYSKSPEREGENNERTN